jgi:hypothetical protein
MFQNDQNNAQGKKVYTSPRLTSRGDILELTRGGGPAPLDAQGTNLGGGNPS